MTLPGRDGSNTTASAVAAYYDGACPLCTREIAFYRRIDRDRHIDWIDVSDCDPQLLPDGLSREAARARFHARLADGALVSGSGAFTALWRALPAFRLAGRLLSGRRTVRLLDAFYTAFLVIRPGLQRLASPRGQTAKSGS